MNDEEKLYEYLKEMEADLTGYYVIEKKAVKAFGWEKAIYISLIKEMAEYCMVNDYFEDKGGWFIYDDEYIFLDAGFDLTDRHKMSSYKKYFEDIGIIETKEDEFPENQWYKVDFLALNTHITEKGKPKKPSLRKTRKGKNTPSHK